MAGTETETEVKTEPFVFGPNQTKWLEALESGIFQQGYMAPYPDHDDIVRYCCLGVANTVCGFHEPSDEVNLRKSYRSLGLYGNEGDIDLIQINDKAMKTRLGTIRYLTGVNDDLKWSFTEIAAFIRANPRAVFTESK